MLAQIKNIRCINCDRYYDITALIMVEVDNMINGKGCICCQENKEET